MKITRLQLENWMGIPRLSLDFSSGINILYGPNETGKSSVIEAIQKAILGDAGSKGKEYKHLVPWGTNVKARVEITFVANDQKEYRLVKSFPGGGAQLYKQGVQLTDDPRKTQDELYKILDISDKTENLFKLLFINQGQSLEIFDPKSKNNPLDDNTKSYIKEVIKETAFKGLQEFKDHIQAQLDDTFTGTGKIKTGSHYKKLLEAETELSAQLEELKEKEKIFMHKLAEIETAQRTIGESDLQIAEARAYLELLKTKKNALNEFEKKKLAFLPIKNDYDAYIERSQDLHQLEDRLPVLAVTRQRRLSQMEQSFRQFGPQKEAALQRIQCLRAKKRQGEELQEARRQFKQFSADYDRVTLLQREIEHIRKEFPPLFAANRLQLTRQLEHLRQALQQDQTRRSELEDIQARIAHLPDITSALIKQLKEAHAGIQFKQAKLTDSRDQLQLSFSLTPHNEREIPYTLSTDGGAVMEGHARKPVNIKGFQTLSFSYPQHFDIAVDGKLAALDVGQLRREIDQQNRELQDALSSFGVESIDALEQKADEIRELNNQLKVLQDRIRQADPPQQLQERQQHIQLQLDQLDQNLQQYCPQGIRHLQPHQIPEPDHTVRDRLTAARTKYDDSQTRLQQLLKDHHATAEELETRFARQKTQFAQQSETYAQLEPRDLETVTDAHLEEESHHLKDLETRLTALETEQAQLRDIVPLPPLPDQTADHPLFTELTVQQLRDDIIQSMNRQRELRADIQKMLANKDAETFKTEYLLRKDEIDQLTDQLSRQEPERLGTLQAVEQEIPNARQVLERNIRQKGDNEKNRERLIGETADFSHIDQAKREVQYKYDQLLQDIKAQITKISTLRLLNQLVDQERESAQQEVFKPLQDRVVKSFSSLVGDRYQIGIDNELNLNVSGKAQTGDFQHGIADALSFGTKEQLSFLFRLSIAAQLSSREAGVMVLDDSFVNTDKQRLPNLLDMVKQRSWDLQFLIFTCHPDDYMESKVIADGGEVNVIDLAGVLEG